MIESQAFGAQKMRTDGFSVDCSLTRIVVSYFACSLMLFIGSAVAAPGDTTLVDVAADGGWPNHESWSASISASGRFVAFESFASNLVPGDTNYTFRDVFLRDLQTHVTTLVSVDLDGGTGVSGESYSPSISEDARYVAFESGSENLVAQETSYGSDIFVRDVALGTTRLVSVAADGGGADSPSQTPAISGNGRYVVFQSYANNLVADDANYLPDVFVRDLQNHTTTRVSVAADGGAANSWSGSYDASGTPAISADGRYVAFVSYASNLVTGDSNGRKDVFLRDLQSHSTTLVSVAADGGPGNRDSWGASISEDGRYVAFVSEASNLVGGDPPNTLNAFVRDMHTGSTELVGLIGSTQPYVGPSLDRASISSNGRYVSFRSDYDVWVRDLLTGAFTLASVAAVDKTRYGRSSNSWISGDGHYVAFVSSADNLVAGDYCCTTNTFAHELDVPVSAADIGTVILPDLNGNSIEEVSVLRDDAVLEIRDGATGSLLRNFPALSTGYWPVAVKALPDSDGNGVPELGVLATRNSDGRAVVEIRNLTGDPAVRQVWFAANHTPLALAVVGDDADSNGVVELAVLSRRDSDWRGLVEVKNANGPTNPNSVWVGAGLTPLDLEIVPDADGNGTPEVAVLSRRDRDGRIVVEVKNAAGPTNPSSVWFMAGNTAIDLAVVADKDGNGIPEVAVLSKRDGDGRMVTEVKNARGPTNPSAVWFAAGHSGLALEALSDADGNAVPDVAVLSRRDSDGRILVEVKNAAGATNPRSLWYPPGHTAWDLAILDDVDGNGTQEASVLMPRDSDGRILIESRNTTGSQAPKDYWFSP